MNYIKLLFSSLLFTGLVSLVDNQRVFCQAVSPGQTFEDIYQHWNYAAGKFRATAGLSKEDFGVFSRFSEKKIDSLRADFTSKIAGGKVTLANAADYENVLIKGLISIYEKFEQIKTVYPSSIEEYKNYRQPMLSQTCDSGCDNINFASGDFTGWYGYFGYNNSDTTATTIGDFTGGLIGAVKYAENDVLTSTPGIYNVSVGANARPDYQLKITSGNLHDALIPALSEVSPFGGNYSVMLGDSTQVNRGVAILSQTFKVTPSNANFTYQYAVVLANPPHNYYQQPFFKVAVLDQAGDTIPFCGEYTVVAQNGIQGFKSFFYEDIYPSGGADTFHVFWKDWTIVNVPLTRYIGQCVTIIFESADCALGGHFGYAYIDASCSPLEIASTSPNFCGQDSITLTGPAGEGHYSWTGPNGGIRGNDTLRQINIDSSGTYTLVVTPFTGATCNDTLTISIGKKGGPPPHPNFTADTGCAGASIPFLNKSNPLNGANFYWDFYNNGTFEDSSVNATWSYNLPGIYQVKLQELYNGCGMDTIIKVVIDSISKSAFVADTVCFNDATLFTNTSVGGITYSWNFGDPSTGANNTSVSANPSHTFSAPGTYTVSLIAKHPGWCNDSVKEKVVVLPLPVPTIKGTDSICYGTSAILTAGGGTSYLWANNGATTSTITVNPTVPTIYTVTVSNGKCTDDTTFRVNIKPKLVGTITGSNVCLGDTVHLSATGGGTYLWNTGATTSSISVAAKSKSDTTYSVIIDSAGGSCLAVTKTITIYPLPIPSVCCTDSIFSGDTITLSASGGSSYYWIPATGLSCDTCPNPIASPTATTVYTLITTSSNGCSVASELALDIKIPCEDFYVPNVFTPNGDGVNDTYLIKVRFMSLYEISIYNRWGKEVFHSTNSDAPWDGNINSLPAAAGVYYYIIRATCDDGNFFKKTGFLQLIRKN